MLQDQTGPRKIGGWRQYVRGRYCAGVTSIVSRLLRRPRSLNFDNWGNLKSTVLRDLMPKGAEKGTLNR